MQQSATRDQNLDLWASQEQIFDLKSRRCYLLEVDQKQEYLLLLQMLLQALQEGSATPFPDAKHLSESWNNQVGIADGSQGHEKYSIGKLVAQLCCHLHTQASFACATRAGQGQEPHLLIAQEVLDGSYFLLSPNERSRHDGQVVRVATTSTECHERWKVGR